MATERGRPGKLSLQYWLYYAFNDWNNTHEGDWEMIQLVFNAGSPEEALERRPVEVGYSQHEGAERADWSDDKLEVVGGTHPVVHPAAGSHANFFDEALHLGRSASEGVGCDDTTGPTFDVRPEVRTVPSDPGRLVSNSRGSSSKAVGVSSSGASSTGRRGRTSNPSGRSPSSGPRAGAAAASPSLAAVRSAQARPTSSAAPSRRDPTR